MKMKKRIIAIASAAVIAAGAFGLGACTEAERVTYNVSQEADNFNVKRRLTVWNTRTDKVLMQMTGYMSIDTDRSDKQLEILCEIGKNKYTKHFVYLNQNTTYIVEDLNGTEVSKYSYELNFNPEFIPSVKIVTED